MIYKIIMSVSIKFNLPKVQLRVKTSPIDTIQIEGGVKPVREHTPCVFQERLKMKKEIQESYIRFRRRKKNNYIKQYSSSKRWSPPNDEKTRNTIELKKKSKNPQDKIYLTLQVEENQRQLILHKHSEHQSHPHLGQKHKQSEAVIPRRELLTGSSRISPTQNHILAKHYSLYDTEISQDMKEHLQLKGKKWECYNHNQSKKLYNHILKLNQKHAKNKPVSGKSSSFRIQAWKPDKLSESKTYFECSHLQIDY